MNKLIINLAPTGMVPTKAMNPYVPITPGEIEKDVEKCIELGASMIHLHARDPYTGIPTYKKNVYADIISRIKDKHPEVIIVVSTSGRAYSEFDKRSEVLELSGDTKPDMASLTLSSLNFFDSASTNSPEMIVNLLEKMNANDIKPELEVFDVGMVNYAKYLILKGLLHPPFYFNILLGNIASSQADLMHLSLIISELPEDSYYSLAGLGAYQKKMNEIGVIQANGVRVGLEDNIWLKKETNTMATNEMLVTRTIKLCEATDRSIATPEEVRNLLHL